MKIISLFVVLLYSVCCISQSIPKLVIQKGHDKEIKELNVSPNEKWILSMDTSKIILWNTNLAKSIYDYPSSPDSKIVFVNDSLFCISNYSKSISFFSVKTGKKIDSLNIEDSVRNLKRFKDKLYLLGNNLYEIKNQRIIKLIKIPNEVSEIEIDPITEKLILYSKNEIFILKDNLITRILSYNDRQLKKKHKKVTILDNRIYCLMYDGGIFSFDIDIVYPGEKINDLYDLLKGNAKGKFTTRPAPDGKANRFVDIAAANSNLYATTQSGIFYIFKPDLTLIKTFLVNYTGQLKIHSNEISKLCFLSVKNEFVMLENKEGIKIQSFEGASKVITSAIFSKNKEAVICSFEGGEIKYFEINPNGYKNHFKIALSDLEFKENWKIYPLRIDNIVDSEYQIEFIKYKYSELSKRTICYKYTAYWDVNSGICRYIENDLERNKYSNESNFLQDILASTKPSNIDRTISWFESSLILELNNNDSLVINFFSGSDMLYQNQPYYFTNKNVSNKVAFLYENEIIGFEQFDPYYNNPAEVFKNLPSVNSELITLYENAYLKRISKLDIKSITQLNASDAPIVGVRFEDSIFVTKDELDVTVSINSKTKHNKLFITVNGVPLENKNGISVEFENLENALDVRIPLVNDDNYINIQLKDDNGLYSQKESFFIFNTKVTRPELYVLSIGVSDYDNDLYDLQYAAKDAKDFENLFNHNQKQFDKVFFLNISDKNFTDLSDTLINFINRPKSNDVLLTFYAGHGVLDNNLKYYLCNSDINFDDPKQNGIEFEILDSIYSTLNCKNRIIILDACHSGEIDKEEVLFLEKVSNSEEISFRGSGIAPKLNVEEISYFEISKEIFTDTRFNSGNLIIASSSGLEFSMEHQELSNGVFTYFLKEGLDSKNADINSNGEITIHEWFLYASQKVTLVTHQIQNPTIRNDNSMIDPVVK